jgi:DNA-binding transcriptional LysR family regulator
VELRHLRYFVAIAEARSFTRAAERLWVAQPGLSTQIRRLEAELGVKLFERHTRGVDLTQAGELFLERARIALDAVDIAGATGRDLEKGIVGSVRLGVATGPRSRLTSDLLRRFSRERPDVELTVMEAYGGTLWRDLRDGRLDVVIAPTGYASADLTTRKLGSEPWLVLVGKGHPLAGIGPASPADLGGERIAITGHRDGAVFDRAVSELLGELGVDSELVPSPPGPALHTAVAANELVALTTAPDALPSGVIARKLDASQALSFELLWRDEVVSPALAGFIGSATVRPQRPAQLRSLTVVA